MTLWDRYQKKVLQGFVEQIPNNFAFGCLVLQSRTALKKALHFHHFKVFQHQKSMTFRYLARLLQVSMQQISMCYLRAFPWYNVKSQLQLLLLWYTFRMEAFNVADFTIRLALGILGIILNAVQIRMITRKRKTRQPFQITLLSLSVADLLIAITLLTSGVDYLLISLNIAHFKGWFYLVQLSFYGFSLLSSMLHVSFIALQRLLAVLYPLRIKRILTGRRCLIAIAVIWVLCSGYITWGMLNLIGSVKKSGSKIAVHSTDSPLERSKVTTSNYAMKSDGSNFTVHTTDSPLRRSRMTKNHYAMKAEGSKMIVYGSGSPLVRSNITTSNYAMKVEGSKLTVHRTISPLRRSKVTTSNYAMTAEASMIIVTATDSTLMSTDIEAMKGRKITQQRSEINGRLLNANSGSKSINTTVKSPFMSTFTSMAAAHDASKTREPIKKTTIQWKPIRNNNNNNNITLKPSVLTVNLSTSISNRNSEKFGSYDMTASNCTVKQNRTDQATTRPRYSVLLDLHNQPMTSLPYIVFSYVIIITCAALVIIYSLTFVLLKTRNSTCANKARKEKYRFVLIYSISLTAIFIVCTLPFTFVIHGISYGNENVPLWPLFLNTTLDPILYFLFSHCKKNFRCCCWFVSRNQSTTRCSEVRLQMPLV